MTWFSLDKALTSLMLLLVVRMLAPTAFSQVVITIQSLLPIAIVPLVAVGMTSSTPLIPRATVSLVVQAMTSSSWVWVVAPSVVRVTIPSPLRKMGATSFLVVQAVTCLTSSRMPPLCLLPLTRSLTLRSARTPLVFSVRAQTLVSIT